MDHEHLHDICLRLMLLVTTPCYIMDKRMFKTVSTDLFIDDIKTYEIVLNHCSIHIRHIIYFGNVLIEYNSIEKKYFIGSESINQLHENLQEIIYAVSHELTLLDQYAHRYQRIITLNQSPLATSVNSVADALVDSFYAFIEWVKQII